MMEFSSIVQTIRFLFQQTRNNKATEPVVKSTDFRLCRHMRQLYNHWSLLRAWGRCLHLLVSSSVRRQSTLPVEEATCTRKMLLKLLSKEWVDTEKLKERQLRRLAFDINITHIQICLMANSTFCQHRAGGS